MPSFQKKKRKKKGKKILINISSSMHVSSSSFLSRNTKGLFLLVFFCLKYNLLHIWYIFHVTIMVIFPRSSNYFTYNYMFYSQLWPQFLRKHLDISLSFELKKKCFLFVYNHRDAGSLGCLVQFRRLLSHRFESIPALSA